MERCTATPPFFSGLRRQTEGLFERLRSRVLLLIADVDGVLPLKSCITCIGLNCLHGRGQIQNFPSLFAIGTRLLREFGPNRNTAEAFKAGSACVDLILQSYDTLIVKDTEQTDRTVQKHLIRRPGVPKVDLKANNSSNRID